jgi:DNA modification methylase
MSYLTQDIDGEELNRMYETDLAVHDWYRFVLSYPPHLVRHYLSEFGIQPGQNVLDPFLGTGTTVVECKKLGIASCGIEANAFTAFASKVKADWSIDPTMLRKETSKILRNFKKKIATDIDFRTLPKEAVEIIQDGSISEMPLHKVLTLRDEIRKANPVVQDILLLALGKHIIYSYSNLKFGPEVGISRKKRLDADVPGIWIEQVNRMAHDLQEYAVNRPVISPVYFGDARLASKYLTPRSVDCVITSPPYPNEKDYSRITRLETVLLGMVNNRKELRTMKEGLLRSNTRNIYVNDIDADAVRDNETVQSICRQIEEHRIDNNRNSGFEKNYHKVVSNYFGGMKLHLIEISKLLTPGAKLAYVVGDQASFYQIMIPTANVLAEIAEEIGFKVEGIDCFRKRFASGTGTYLKEEVLKLSWSK